MTLKCGHYPLYINGKKEKFRYLEATRSMIDLKKGYLQSFLKPRVFAVAAKLKVWSKWCPFVPFLDFESSPEFPPIWGWKDSDRIVLFRVNLSFNAETQFCKLFKRSTYWSALPNCRHWLGGLLTSNSTTIPFTSQYNSKVKNILWEHTVLWHVL